MSEKFLADGSGWKLSLSKLLGKKIKDVHGYITDMGGGATFKLTDIVLEDDSEVSVEGEHDFPYITEYAKYPQQNLDEETLEGLMDEESYD